MTLGRVPDREAGERRQSRLIRGVGQHAECSQRLVRLLASEARGVLEAAGGFDGGDDRLELRESAALMASRIAARCASVPCRSAWISGRVGLPSARSSPRFLPRSAGLER